ncbi:hypothetical protein TM239_33100 [Bradyrhizobium sp. TM239]|nr:hypothetical protein TM233_40840 [Bradyrhizobium sp. TM233]GMP02882.1 hypothetical protein TM239_33100 [Bradyrhizobium sp. TM239]
MDPDRDHEPVAQRNAVPDHVQMAVGDGVEGTGIEGNARHGPLLPRPARPGKPGRFPGQILPKYPAGHVGNGRLFRPSGNHETKGRGQETISRAGEDVRKLAMVTNPANE